MIDFMKLKAVIWDMDGVLVDSESVHQKTWRTVFENFNIKVYPERLKRSFGMTSEMVVQMMLDEPLDKAVVKDIILQKGAIFQKAISKEAVFLPGVQGWLASFQKNNVKQAVASSGTSANIQIVLDKLAIKEYFDVIVSGTGFPSKPNPIIFLKTADQLGEIPLNCLVIEDSTAGVQAAKAAGMKCIGVATTNQVEKLTGADVIVENLAQLMTEQVQGLFSVG